MVARCRTDCATARRLTDWTTVRSMSFDPQRGMTPNDWAEMEARREERVQRADNPHGREISGRSRLVTAWILGLVLLALAVYAILGWTGLVDVPGFVGWIDVVPG